MRVYPLQGGKHGRRAPHNPHRPAPPLHHALFTWLQGCNVHCHALCGLLFKRRGLQTPDERSAHQGPARQAQARSAWLPQISAGISRQRSQQRFTGTPQANSSRTTYANSQNMGLRWRLWDFGARHARSEAARLQLQAALASQHATVHQALVEVLQRYTQAQIAQSRLQAQ